MVVQVALLRGVNVGGANRLAMADLRRVAEGLGLAGVRTLLQSGNLVFETGEVDAAALERDLEASIAARLGVSADVLVREAAAWRRAIDANPFPAQAAMDPAHLLLVALRDRPDPDAKRRLEAAIRGPERACIIGREVYIDYPAGIGRSPLTAAVIDRALGVRGTARNWNTVLRIAALAGV